MQHQAPRMCIGLRDDSSAIPRMTGAACEGTENLSLQDRVTAR